MGASGSVEPDPSKVTLPRGATPPGGEAVSVGTGSGGVTWTGAVAAALIARGGLRINRQPIEKPHARLRPGDILTVPLSRGVVVIEVLGLAKRREGAPLAQTLYKEIVSG